MLAWPFVRGLVSSFDATVIGGAVARWATALANADERDLDPQHFTSGAASQRIGALRVRRANVVSVAVWAISLAVLPEVGAAALARVVGLRVPLGSLAFQALVVVVSFVSMRVYLVGIGRLSEVTQAMRHGNVLFKALWMAEAPQRAHGPSLAEQPGLHPFGMGMLLFPLLLAIWSMVALVACRLLGGTSGGGHAVLILLRLLLLPVALASSYEAHLLLLRFYYAPIIGMLIGGGLRLSRPKLPEPDMDELEVGACAVFELDAHTGRQTLARPSSSAWKPKRPS